MPHPEFFAGLLAAAFLVCALFFLRFWRRARDGLFLAFALAFALLALQQFLTTFLGLPEEDRSWVYLLRLAAFLIVIFAILRKNMQKR
jgi:drug/metabolite transporter (DMT)-like permease